MSAVDIQIGDKWFYDLSDWSIQGGSMPTTPGDMTGGALAVSFQRPEGVDAKILGGKPVLLRDPDRGDAAGEITLAGGNSVNATLTGVNRLAKLNVTRTTAPYEGTLRGYILYLLSLCGITTDIKVSAAVAERTFRVIGWEGNVLDHLKDLCSVHGVTTVVLGKTIGFIGINEVPTLSAHSIADYTWQQDDTQLAQSVEASWFDTKPIANQLIYPAGGWNPDVQVFTVDAGQTIIQEIDLRAEDGVDGAGGMSAVSVNQPTCVASVSRYHNSSSVYSVSGKDGIAIQPAQWRDGGGDLKVELIEGGARLRVTITGSSESRYAPYSIAMSSGPSDNYSSLRIYGRGMRYTRNIITAGTGVNPDRAPQETAPPVTTPFLNSREAAFKAIEGLLDRHGATGYTIQGTIGRPFKAHKAPAVNWFGIAAPESLDLDTRVFGLLEGAVFYAEGMAFRIRSTTYTPSKITFTAERYVPSRLAEFATSGWHENVPTITNANSFNAAYPAGMTADQYNAIQLKGFTL